MVQLQLTSLLPFNTSNFALQFQNNGFFTKFTALHLTLKQKKDET